MVPRWDLDHLAHDHRAGQNFALLFDLVEPAAHREDAVQRVDDRVGVEQPLHSFGGSLLPPAAHVSRKMPEQLLDVAQVGLAFAQVRCAGVAQAEWGEPAARWRAGSGVAAVGRCSRRSRAMPAVE